MRSLNRCGALRIHFLSLRIGKVAQCGRTTLEQVRSARMCCWWSHVKQRESQHVLGLTFVCASWRLYLSSQRQPYDCAMQAWKSCFLSYVSPLDTSNIASYNDSHTVSNDGGQSATTLSPNEIVKDYITIRSSEFCKLGELRSLVSPRCTHIVR